MTKNVFINSAAVQCIKLFHDQQINVCVLADSHVIPGVIQPSVMSVSLLLSLLHSDKLTGHYGASDAQFYAAAVNQKDTCPKARLVSSSGSLCSYPAPGNQLEGYPSDTLHPSSASAGESTLHSDPN